MRESTISQMAKLNPTTSSGDSVYGGLDVLPSEVASAHDLPPATDAPRRKALVAREVETAVYAHIRAMRTLGHTTLNTGQIATALSLPQRDVDMAVANLRNRGVKVVAR